MTILEDTSQQRWFGIQTHLRKEIVAAEQLKLRGYDVYLPLYRKRKYWSDRRVEVDCPLFPGYLFCRLDVRCPPIVAVPSVVSVIGRGKQPEPIPEQEIVAVQNMLRSGFAIEQHPYLREGEKVAIVSGPLRGIEGFLVRTKGNSKLVISVTLFQRSVAVEMSSDVAGEPLERTDPVSRRPVQNLSQPLERMNSR